MIADEVKQLEHENIRLKAEVRILIDTINKCYGSGAAQHGGADPPKDCGHCGNFIQHYVKLGDTYNPVYDGHCVAGNRIKGRKVPDTCGAFVPKERGQGNEFKRCDSTGLH